MLCARFALTSVVLAFVLSACASRREPPELVVDPLPPRGGRALGSTPKAPPAPSHTATPSARALPAFEPDPEASRSFLARYGGPSSLLTPNMRASRVHALAFDGSVRGQTRGSLPDGPLVFAKLGEGQLALMPVSLPAGACVTVVAQGGIGVVELDLFLVASDATGGDHDGPRILTEDRRSGPTSVIGGRVGCFPIDHALEATLFVQMRKGAGAVLVQRFLRSEK